MLLRRCVVIFVLLIATLAELLAQAPGIVYPYQRHDNDLTPTKIYEARRNRIKEHHSSKSLVLFLSADIRNRQNDVDYEYRQNSNMLYVSGCIEPKTALILLPGLNTQTDNQTDEIFFVQKRNQNKEVWTGAKLGLKEAESELGIKKAIDYTQLRSVLDSLLQGRDTLYIGSGYPTSSVQNQITGKITLLETQTKEYLKEKFPNLVVRGTLPLLATMREVKDNDELRLLQRAIDISVSAHSETIRSAKPGMKEYELEAIMEYNFKKLGAEDVGYPSIVGSGYNACILHYEINRRPTNTGDLVLADCGAEYHGYTADITRTFPIKGRFTEEQRIIYNIVLEAQDSGISACVKNNEFRSAHRAASAVIERRLTELGIIQNPKELSYYFMHGTSHYLGLDVHDLGTYGLLKPGVVMTVEPGIYIPAGSPCDKKWWNIGIRIEDDILVTEGEPFNMSGALPRTAEGIEAMMQAGK